MSHNYMYSYMNNYVHWPRPYSCRFCNGLCCYFTATTESDLHVNWAVYEYSYRGPTGVG